MTMWYPAEYDSVDSTNLKARRLVEAGKGGAGLVVRARHQEAGRGRLQRGWFDLPDKSLLASLVLEGMPGPLATRLACISAVAAVRALGGSGPRVKWPNDLVYGRRKAGGVLAESLAGAGRGLTVVGIGINLDYGPGELPFPAATSLLVEEGRRFDPDLLLRSLLKEVESRAAGAPGAWAREYAEALAWMGETVTVLPPFSVPGGAFRGKPELRGIMRGVDGEGFLLLDSEGGLIRVAAGDLRPGEAGA